MLDRNFPNAGHADPDVYPGRLDQLARFLRQTWAISDRPQGDVRIQQQSHAFTYPTNNRATSSLCVWMSAGISNKFLAKPILPDGR